MLTDMDDITSTRDLLNRHLDQAIEVAPLAALAAIAATQRDLSARVQTAVRASAPLHTWAEIGAALGVSKQAAQQRYAKEWASTLKEELKTEHKAMKTALRKGELYDAAEAKARRDAVVAEFKDVHRRVKRDR